MTWGRRAKGPEDVSRLPGEDEQSYLERLAKAHLEPEVAARWLRLTRPAIRLTAAQDGDHVVARLGGRPWVPEAFEWPTWDGHGPLSFVAEVDLAAIAATSSDPGLLLPAEGRLLAFYFDGSFDDFEGIVGPWDKESLAGARLVHVLESREVCQERAAPDGVLEFGRQALTSRTVMTWPDREHPVLDREFGTPRQDHQEWTDRPVDAEPFTDALWALHEGEPLHQIGGWASPEQGPVELEVAELDAPLAQDDEAHVEEALRWHLLLQVDSDDASDMIWGDVGRLYWLTRAAESPSASLSRVSFTWQCG